MYDVDGNGWIDLSEMTRLVGSIYKMLGQHQLVQQVRDALKKGDICQIPPDPPFVMIKLSFMYRRRPETELGPSLRRWTPTVTGASPGTSL